MNEAPEHGELVGQRLGAIAEEPQHVAGAVKRMRDQAACNRGPYRMKLIFEGTRDAEVSTSTPNGPEEIGLFVPAVLSFSLGSVYAGTRSL